MRAHVRHILICTGPRCGAEGGQAHAMFRRIGEMIDARPTLKTKRTRTQCFMACKEAPVLVVYPEGVWYRRVDERALERIVTEHLEGGQEVTDLVFHRLEEGDVLTSDQADEPGREVEIGERYSQSAVDKLAPRPLLPKGLP